jgi:hypothetical protein
MMLIDIRHKGISIKNPRIGEFVIKVLEQAKRKLRAILWRNSVIFGENFSDGRILSAILLESRSKSSRLGRRASNSSGRIYVNAREGDGQVILKIQNLHMTKQNTSCSSLTSMLVML